MNSQLQSDIAEHTDPTEYCLRVEIEQHLGVIGYLLNHHIPYSYKVQIDHAWFTVAINHTEYLNAALDEATV